MDYCPNYVHNRYCECFYEKFCLTEALVWIFAVNLSLVACCDYAVVFLSNEFRSE